MYRLRRSLAQNWLEWLVLGAIVALAAFLRLVRLDLAVFQDGEAEVLTLASSFLETGYPPLVGIKTSVDNFNTPVMVYLMALPMIVSSDPAIATGLLALLNVLAIFLTYRFSKDYFGRQAAIMAALLFAVSFWAVTYSRRIFDLSTAPLWSVLLVGSLCSWIVHHRPRQLVWAFLWLSLLVQFHYSAMAYLPFFLLVLALYWRRIRVPHLLLGVGAALVPALPFIYGQVKADFADLRTILSLSAGAANYDLSSLCYAVQLLSTDGYTTFFTRSQVAWLSEPIWLPWLRNSLAALFGLGLLYLVWQLVRLRCRVLAPEGTPWLLIFLWFWMPVLFFTRHSTPVYDRYLLMVYPAVFIIMGTTLSQGLTGICRWMPRLRCHHERLNSLAAAVVFVFLLIQAAGQSHAFLRSLQWVDSGAATSTFGLPLNHTQALVNFLAAEWQLNASNTRVYIAPEETLFTTVKFLAKERFPLHLFDGQHTLVLPFERDRDAWYLFTSQRSRAVQFISQQWPDALVERLPHPGGEDTSLLIRLTGDERSSFSGTQQPVNVALGNGLRLVDYTLPDQARAGQDLLLTILWQVETPSGTETNADYRWFAHLLDHKGRKWTQTDVIGYPAKEWRAGDEVLSWLDLKLPREIPLGQYWLSLGMYNLHDLKRVPVSAGEGEPVADSLSLGPIKVLPADPTILTQPPPLPHTSNAVFGETIALLGYEVTRTPGQEGQEQLAVTLAWRSQAKVDQDYTVFLHLVDAQGNLLAQADGPPLQGAYPTSAWQPGEIIADTHTITLPKATMEQATSVQVGLYSLTTLERLPVRFTTGQTADKVTISREQWQ